MRSPCLLLILATTACQSLPKDPWLRAVKEVDRGELLGAIRDLDLLPPTHPRYGEARILAQAVERRLRTSQDLVQRGLRLRAQWRDEEALRQFELAQEVWPQVQGARDLEKATLNRIHAMDPQSEDQWGELGVEPDPEIMPAAPNGETSALPAKPVLEGIIARQDRARSGRYRLS